MIAERERLALEKEQVAMEEQVLRRRKGVATTRKRDMRRTFVYTDSIIALSL